MEPLRQNHKVPLDFMETFFEPKIVCEYSLVRFYKSVRILGIFGKDLHIAEIFIKYFKNIQDSCQGFQEFSQKDCSSCFPDILMVNQNPSKFWFLMSFVLPCFVVQNSNQDFNWNKSDIRLPKRFSQMVTPYFKVRNLSVASTFFYHLLGLPVWYLYEVEEGLCILTSSSNDITKYFNLAICIIYLLGQLFPLFLANASCFCKISKYRKEQREIGLKAVRTTQVRDQDNSSLLTAAQIITSSVNSQNQQQGCQ